MTHQQVQFQKPAQTSSKAMFESQTPEADTLKLSCDNSAAEQQQPGAHTMTDIFESADLIHSYSRAQAIADGVLIDVSETAREAGFTVPVAITRAAWADCVEWTAETDKRKAACQDEAGRLWDVVYMARLAARVVGDQPRRLYDLYRVPVEGRGIKPRRVTLAMHIGPGDAGEPVITISKPNED